MSFTATRFARSGARRRLIAVMQVFMRVSVGSRTSRDGARGKRDEELAVLDAFQAHQGIGERAHFACRPTEHDHFHAIVVADVNVQHGNDQFVVVVLQRGHLMGEVGCVVVVDECQAAEDFGGLLRRFDPRPHERVADQVAQSLGARRVALRRDEAVEAFQQLALNADAESQKVAHPISRLFSSMSAPMRAFIISDPRRGGVDDIRRASAARRRRDVDAGETHHRACADVSGLLPRACVCAYGLSSEKFLLKFTAEHAESAEIKMFVARCAFPVLILRDLRGEMP